MFRSLQYFDPKEGRESKCHERRLRSNIYLICQFHVEQVMENLKTSPLCKTKKTRIRIH